MTVTEAIATIVALGSVATLTVSNMDNVQKDATVQLQAHNCRMLAYYERMEKVSNINIEEYRQEVMKHGDCLFRGQGKDLRKAIDQAMKGE